jgi:hypothetical protein
VSLLSAYRRGLSAFSNRIRVHRDRDRDRGLVTGLELEKSYAGLRTRHLPGAVQTSKKRKAITTITFITTMPRASWVLITTITTITTTTSIQTPYYISASRTTGVDRLEI